MSYNLEEGIDYYLEDGLYVFTEKYHLDRGYCCGSGCRHCPYDKKVKVALSWSGGKDSALALHRVLQDTSYEIDHIFTIFDRKTRRVGLHGIHEDLIDAQARSLGLPLKKLYLEASEGHDNYEKLISKYYRSIKKESIHHVVHGDIFLEDLKSYRDDILRKADLDGIYPLWKESPYLLMEEFIRLGFKTITCAIKYPLLNEEFLGRIIDRHFLDELPNEVDLCGENGEFHTFLIDGPIFSKKISVDKGEVVSKEYHYQVKDNDELQQFVTTIYFLELTLSKS